MDEVGKVFKRQVFPLCKEKQGFFVCSFLSYKFTLSRTRRIGIADLVISVKSFIGQKGCSSEGMCVEY